MPGRGSGPPGIVFGPGSRGVNRQIPSQLLDADELYNCFNMYFYNGALQPRAGLRPIDDITNGGAPTWDTRPMGAYCFVKDNLIPVILVSTQDLQYKLEGMSWTAWTNITEGASTTPVPLTGGNDNLVRFTSIQYTGLPTVVMTNGANHLKATINGAETIDLDPGGALPAFWDITTVANRVIGAYSPYGIRWSDIQNPTVWPSLNFRNLSDTGDKIIAIKKLGTQAMVIYKLFNLWVGYSQAGSPANAFRFDWKGEFESPASQAAVVDAGGVHYYLSRTGRIGRFDGVTHTWVADGVWPIIQGDMNPAYPQGVFGIYHPSVPVVIFHYPRLTDTPPNVTGVVYLNLPRPQIGIPYHAAFPGAMAKNVCCGTTIDLGQLGIYSSIVTTDNASILWPLAGTGDQGTAFDCIARTGLKPTQSVSRIEIEPFVERGVDYGTMTLEAVTSNVLDTPSGSVSDDETIDLEDTTLVRDTHGFEATGRFVGVRISCTSDDNVRYKGASVSGHPLEQT